jgi:signal transduction histidine kinase
MASELERRDMLLEAGLALSSELSLSTLLQRIVELAAKITGARYGALGVIGSGGDLIAEFITSGVSDEQRHSIGHPPVGRGILWVLIHEALPLRLREISADPRSVGFPPNHPEMHTFLGSPVTSRHRVFGNIYLTEKAGGAEFTAEDQRALEILAAQAGVAIENARLYEESHQRERRLESIREIGTAILSGAEPEEVLELVARRAMEMVEADTAIVAVADEEPGRLVLTVAVGAAAEALVGMSFPADRSISGETIRTGSPIVLADASKDSRAHRPMVEGGQMGPAMWVPLHSRGEAFGTLAVSNVQGGRAFTAEDVALVETFAGQASVALEYGRAQQELKKMAVLEDRERIAKELHDGVIQALFAVGMGLQGTAQVSRDPEIERRIENAVEEMDRVIRDLRNYIFGLRPGILADRQLDQALRGLAEDFEQKSGVTTVVDVDPGVAAELASVAADVIQLVREALSNIGRHAMATTCRITLRRTEGGSLLEIDDDGVGFDVEEGTGRGFGLGNLRARAEALHGDLTIESVAGEGTTVRVRLPA